MLEKYASFCYDQIGSYILDSLDYFEDIRPHLSKANIQVSLPEYVSAMVLSSMFVSITTLTVLGSILMIGSGIAGLIYGMILSLISGTLTLVGFYIYPSIIIKSRASKIRDTLPFATMYLSTLAGTGTSLPKLFKVLSEVDEYGEVAKEAERISRDIETFNMDTNEALKNAAERTPSEDFKNLMWGMNHTLTSGGSLRSFLRERSDTLMNDYRRRVEEFSETLSLLVEMYITVVIVGSIIFTSMSLVMTTFSPNMSTGFIVRLQVLSIFIGLPMISGMFIVLVGGLAPGGIR
ncbi:type II secretion system F family protein [Candidatus Nanohalococcus occultus]|uniref:Archaeal flagellar protein FlaJ n=1 Tax=Candidatus Nanohalococcus occultus TaxID=2978047 RepID=A0ABY8CJH4_9ARCH|nr:Archaeal flagellar protein FlaJ [Candidatus Nanohaloarchaeota archaeon SVXNc]